MNNAALPYLKQIADALGNKDKNADKKRDEELTSIAKNISTATVTNNNVSMAGNENTKAINETLAKGLIVTVQDGSSEVEKSIFALMFEMLQSALYATVTENNQTVVKGIAQLVNEQNTLLGQIKDSLYDGSTTPATTVLSKLDDIENALGSSVDAQTIADGIDQSSALQAINGTLSTDTNNIQSKVGEIRSDTDLIRAALHDPYNANNTIYGKVSGIGNDTDAIRSNTSYIQGISVFVEDIDNKM